MFALEFSSGHVLALRVFPEGDFGAFTTVWHRGPEGRWSIHVDALRPEGACPRYFGPACDHTGPASIGVRWTSPSTVRVTMDHPALEWTLTVTSSTVLRLVNAVSSVLPTATWRPRILVRLRELLVRALGLGAMRLTIHAPSGHTGLLMPTTMYDVATSRATLAGRDLGRPVRSPVSPAIGDVVLPARGVLAVGEVVWRVLDPAAPRAS